VSVLKCNILAIILFTY